jgi:RecA-family ATPase
MIVLDAFYRFIPAGMRENENADMTQIYNQIDRIAAKANAAILVVHHTTKGIQTEKSTMDVGAGASAIGRATDSHVTFLRHADDGYLVMNAETRSFKRAEPRVIHVDWPDIAFDSTKDTTKLWNPKVKASKEE